MPHSFPRLPINKSFIEMHYRCLEMLKPYLLTLDQSTYLILHKTPLVQNLVYLFSVIIALCRIVYNTGLYVAALMSLFMEHGKL